MIDEKVLAQILSANPEMSERELLKRLEGEKHKTGGFISDEALLRMIAAEMGVDFSSTEAVVHTVSVRDLVPNLNDVTVVGRVIALFAPKAFSGRRSGKLASLLVADKKDILRVVFWNDQTSLIESGKIAVGQIMRFSHGYTKEDLIGKIELHVSSKSKVEINPADVNVEDYPTINQFLTSIGEISPKFSNRKVNVSGIVTRVLPSSVFEREDSSSGKVMRFVLADETGEISVVAWNEKVDEFEKVLRQGAGLQVVNGRVKKAIGEGVELHINGGTYVETFELVEKFSKIAELRAGLNNVNVEGEIVTEPSVRSVRTSKGEVVKLASFGLKDETGRVWFSAWRTHSDIVLGLSSGDKVVIKDVFVREGFGEQLEIISKDTTSIDIIR
jgi:replication factor A1